jgi:hypothetical protein
MSFKAIARFRCDGCKVTTSEDIEILADVLQACPPRSWLRVEAVRADVAQIRHYCPVCAPLIENYLQGRPEGMEAGDDD